MKKTLDLPTELWIETLKLLDFHDLNVVSLACKRFRALAAPNLFRCLCFSTVTRGDGKFSWGCSKTSLAEVQKPLTPSTMDQLLKFYGSERIAPLVREFWLILHSDYRPVEPSIDAILALIRRLPRLGRIVFRLATLDARIMHALEQLPALTSICMKYCTSSTTDIPHLRVKKVELLDSGPWPFTIDPDSLERLYIENCGPPAASHLPNLRTLSIDTHDVPSVFCCLEFLVNCSCPSLKTLTLSSTNQEYELPANIYGLPTIPSLRRFRGPIKLAPIFATGGSLLHVNLYEGGESFVAADVLPKLHRLAPNLVTLTVDVPYVNEPVLRAAFSFLHLEELCIESTVDEKMSFQACRRSLHLSARPLIGLYLIDSHITDV
jgi:hypothetical protein